MRKNLKFLFAILGVFALLLGVTACTEPYDFYKDWTENTGLNIPEDHIFSVLTKDEVIQKKNDKETFVLICSTSKYTHANQVFTTFQNYAEESAFNYQGKIYFLDATPYYTNQESRNELKTALGSYNTIGETGEKVIVMIYEKGLTYLDTSNTKSAVLEEFKFNGYVSYELIAIYAFRLEKE